MATAELTTTPRVDWTKVATFAAVFVAAALAAASGLGAGQGSKTAVVLPVAIGCGLVLAVLSLTRFQLFVVVLLIARSSLDLAKLSQRTAGTTSVGASSRALDPSSILAVLFMLAAGVWLAAQYHYKGSLPGSPLRRALVLFLAAGVVSVFGSNNITSSALEAFRICAVVAMFTVLEQMITNVKKAKQILLAAFLATVIPLLYTTYGFISGHPKSDVKGGYTRISGTFNQSNDYGRFLMLMIIMGAAVYPHVARKWQRLMIVMLGLSGVYLFFTYTRSALVATALGLLIVGFIQSKRLLAGLLVAGMAGLLLVPSLSGRFSDLTQYQAKQLSQTGGANGGNTLAWRLSYWTQVLPLANSNPITGIGLNQTKYSTDKAKQPHNDFVRAYVETGLVGFFAYVAMLVSLVLLGRRAVLRTRKGTFEHGVAAGFLGCAVAFIAVSVVANVISNVVNLWYFIAFAACTSAIVKIADRREAMATLPAPR
ncbi:MAG TPA: O-antigen ligase family protein [Acidimicrobiales bacterium]|jgi:O-antigen ligase|nr:O-antigen ligase family protein [Acidimicrobiales bacterium]